MTTDKIQFGWHACTKCGGLFYMDRTPIPTCKKDGQPHTPALTNRGVPFVRMGKDLPTGSGDESSWHFCINCHGLFCVSNASGNVCNHAKSGTVHVMEGSTYILFPMVGPPTSPEDKEMAYYECIQCGGLFHDWNSTNCNTDGPHETAWVEGKNIYYLLPKSR